MIFKNNKQFVFTTSSASDGSNILQGLRSQLRVVEEQNNLVYKH